jgi:hypothetical protein
MLKKLLLLISLLVFAYLVDRYAKNTDKAKSPELSVSLPVMIMGSF